MATPAIRKKSSNSWRGFFFAVLLASLGVVWLVHASSVVLGGTVSTLLTLVPATTVEASIFVVAICVVLFAVAGAVTTARSDLPKRQKNLRIALCVLIGGPVAGYFLPLVALWLLLTLYDLFCAVVPHDWPFGEL